MLCAPIAAYAADVYNFADLQAAAAGTDSVIDIYADIASTAEVGIARDITINGNGHTIAGDDTHRLLKVTGAATINDLTFIGGDSTLVDGGTSGGGALQIVSSGSSLLSDCTFVGNTGSNGGAVANFNGDVIIERCSFYDNRAVGTGYNTAGAIDVDNGRVEFRGDNYFDGNSAVRGDSDVYAGTRNTQNGRMIQGRRPAEQPDEAEEPSGGMLADVQLGIGLHGIFAEDAELSVLPLVSGAAYDALTAACAARGKTPAFMYDMTVRGNALLNSVTFRVDAPDGTQVMLLQYAGGRVIETTLTVANGCVTLSITAAGAFALILL